MPHTPTHDTGVSIIDDSGLRNTGAFEDVALLNKLNCLVTTAVVDKDLALTRPSL